MAQINQPNRPKAYCAKNGCIEFVHDNLSYCKEHAEESKGPQFRITLIDTELDGFNAPDGYHYKDFERASSRDDILVLWERDE